MVNVALIFDVGAFIDCRVFCQVRQSRLAPAGVEAIVIVERGECFGL